MSYSLDSVFEEYWGLAMPVGAICSTKLDPVFEDRPQVRSVGGRLLIGHLAFDEASRDYWEDRNRSGSLRTFSGLAPMKKYMDSERESGKACLRVDHHKHSGSHYSVANTSMYPDRPFDVSSWNAYTPPDDVQEEYRRRRQEDGAVPASEWLIDCCNATLDEYSDWCNGAVFAACIEVWEQQDKGLPVRIADEATWGHIGAQWANAALEDAMQEKERHLMDREAASGLEMGAA